MLGGVKGFGYLIILGWLLACGTRPPGSHAEAAVPRASATICPSASAEQPAVKDVPPVAPSAAPAPTSAAAAPDVLAYPKYSLNGTLTRDLHSVETGKHHQLLISVPGSFTTEPDRRYPLLVLLDGQWDFALVNAMASSLRYDEVATEMLIVGVSYGGENPDYGALRADDYIPTRAKHRSGREMGGGAGRFLAWIEAAVLPLMERDYRADPARRILAGASHGGLFTLYTLFEKPELFWAYLAVSPSAGWNEREVFRREKAFRAAHPRLERRVWLCSGSLERPDYLAEELAFFKQFTQSRYAGLSLKIHSVEGERHGGLKAEAYNRGLRFIFEPLPK